MVSFLLEALPTIENPDPIEKDAYLAGKAMDDFLRLCFSKKSAFLSRMEAVDCIVWLRVWAEKFYSCALGCNTAELCFFPLTPKYHYINHVCWDLQKQLLSGAEEVLNPKIFSAQMAEDHVGRASRICRSVHPRTVSLRTAQKWLVQTKTLFERPLVE